MIAAFLARCVRYCLAQAKRRRIAAEMRPDFDFMTDAELSDVVQGRGHTIDWTEVARRRQRGDIQVPGLMRGAR